jgi:ankyrin repeat protein
MSYLLIKKRGEPIPMNLFIVFFMAVGLTASCTNMRAKQSDNRNSPQVTNNRETPVALHATKQNKGERCGPRVYTQSKGDEDYHPYCHAVQLKLVQASEKGNLDEMREALKEGANPDGSVYDHFPPLLAATINGKTEAVRLLLDNGSDVNQEADFQNTALGLAVEGRYIDVVRVLLERGANVCYKTLDGTDEDFARKKGYQEIAELLNAAKATNCK